MKSWSAAMQSISHFCVAFARREEGQMAPFAFSGLLIAYSLFMGATIDMANLWLHQYRASTAAQAACESGAADLMWVANQGTAQAISNYEATSTGFPLAVSTGSGTYTAPPSNTSLSGNCSSGNSSVAMCAYAKANGYDPAASGVKVSWTVSNVTPVPQTFNPNGNAGVSSYTPPSALPATPPVTQNGVLPYLHVTVTESVPTYLLSVIPSFSSPVTVSGQCNCGMVVSNTTSAEMTLTGACPISETTYSSQEWDIAGQAPFQLRTIGSNYPENWVLYKCNDTWVDSQGTSHPWNYLSTLSNITIDGIQIKEYAGTQDNDPLQDGYSYLWAVGLISSPSPFTSTAICCIPNNPPYAVGTASYPGSPLPYSGESAPATLFTYGSASTLWGSNSGTLLSALSTNYYFGFAVDVLGGNEHRDFLGYGGSTFSGVPNITVYYHTGSYVVSSF